MKYICPQETMDGILEKIDNPGATRSSSWDPATQPNLCKLYKEFKAMAERCRRQPEGKIIQFSDYQEVNHGI